MTVLELRNYRLKPGTLEPFIDYFEEHFVSSQEELNMQILGQFRLLGQPDHFVWLRGFPDMQSRLDSLREFYGGPVWEKYGPAANDMMLEWHNVHLLRPLGAEADLALHGTGLMVLDIFRAKSGRRDMLIHSIQSRLNPVYRKLHIQMRGMFVAEMSPNEYPRLPVIQDENVLVIITAYENIAAFWDKHEMVSHAVDIATFGFVSAPPETLMLSPTARNDDEIIQVSALKTPYNETVVR